VLAWPEILSFGELRRLQLSAKSTRETVFLFRDRKATNTSSPAVLRLQLTTDDGDLRVKVLKCRGQRPASSIHIRRSQLFQLPMPALPGACGPDQHPGSSPESPTIQAQKVSAAGIIRLPQNGL
jgi:hypothetical protein